MATVGLVLTAAGGLAGGIVTAQETTPAAAVTVAGRGEELFLTSCASCHGPQGAGGPGGPDIRQAGAALADFVLRTGRMPLADPNAPELSGPRRFDEPDTQALVEYVASLGDGPAIPNVVVSGADVNHGRQLYVANCSACHGPAGGGGAVGGGFVAPDLTLAGPTTLGEAVITGPGPMPRFSFAPGELERPGRLRGVPARRPPSGRRHDAGRRPRHGGFHRGHRDPRPAAGCPLGGGPP